jgi:hypothetical protein
MLRMEILIIPNDMIDVFNDLSYARLAGWYFQVECTLFKCTCFLNLPATGNQKLDHADNEIASIRYHGSLINLSAIYCFLGPRTKVIVNLQSGAKATNIHGP